MKAARFFETRRRDNGEEFATLTDEVPEWLAEAVREAHAGDLPNDWIYAESRAACEAIDQGTLRNDDDLHEHADGRVDVYTKALFAWAADMSGTSTWSNAEGEADDVGTAGGCEGRIRVVQFFAIKSVASSMLGAVTAHGDEGEEV